MDLDLSRDYPGVFETLLRDHTTQKNIFWATHNYRDLGERYSFKAPILPELISGDKNRIIIPRVQKDDFAQQVRVKEMAEVFTPSWVCNAQNNLIDEAWFGRSGVFNTEIIGADGKRGWVTNPEPVSFPEGKTWLDYVQDTRLEITCGEAPYITSRYDTTTGDFISIAERIGLLDRKLRVINENVHNSTDWLKAAQLAYKSTYAYEWQGDSLLIARESMLKTFFENFEAKFSRKPFERSLKYIAYIISWNVWQMDGLKAVIPDSCGITETVTENFFG
nr:restriction endonuclease subunit M [Cyclonatronum proteinivorum]